MKILKLMVGAALLGALANLLVRQRARPHAPDVKDPVPEGSALPTVLVADESSVGEGSGDDRVQLPEDGRLTGSSSSS